MDYSKNVKASEAADFVYAEWYSKLPQERKAKFFQDGFDFVANKIKYDVLQENPFATDSDIKLRFIELTQQEAYSPEMFSFIKKEMKKRSEQDWKARFKIMKKTLGWNYEEMANYMGAENGASVKASVNRKLPAFAKLAVCLFEQMEIKKNDDSPHNTAFTYHDSPES